MARPFLLAQSPRAGNKNHRYLVSKGSELDEGAAVNLIAAAQKNPYSTDYLSVRKCGVQQVDGGRTGDEVLLLGGINATLLKNKKKEKVLNCLKQHLEDLNGIIGKINWESRIGLLVEDETFSRWLDEDFQKILPKRHLRAQWWHYVVALLLVALLVISATVWSAYRQPTAAKNSKAKTIKPYTVKDGTPTDQLFAQFLKVLKCQQEERAKKVVREFAILLKVEPKRKVILKNDKMKNWLEAWEKERNKNPRQPLNPFFFLPPEEARTLRVQMEGKNPSIEEVCLWRKSLAKVAKEFRGFREWAKLKNLDSLSFKDEYCPFLSMAKQMAVFVEGKNIPSYKIEPIVPLFSAHDEEAFYNLKELVWKAAPKKVKDEIKLNGNQTIFDQVELIKKYQKFIKDTLQNEVESAINDNSISEDMRDRIITLKGRMNLLIVNLSKIETPSAGENQPCAVNRDGGR